MDDLPNRGHARVVDLGVVDLLRADDLITHLADLRQQDAVPDVVLMLSYNPCLSVGVRQMDPADFLKPLDYFTRLHIPLHKSVRGGGLSYHWPGQLICYPILKLHEDEKNIPRYMYKLEQIGLDTLAELGVHAARKRDQTAQIGLWVNNSKVASMGIRISRWVTSYGFALNLTGDTSPSQFIRPCGLDNVNLTTVEQLTGKSPDRDDVKQRVMGHFESQFQRTLHVEQVNWLGEQGIVYEYGRRNIRA